MYRKWLKNKKVEKTSTGYVLVRYIWYQTQQQWRENIVVTMAKKNGKKLINMANKGVENTSFVCTPGTHY